MRLYEVHQGAEGLAALKEPWEVLEATGSDHFFQTHSFATLWQRTIGTTTGAKPLIVTLREDGRVVGIFPACRVRQSGVPLIAWVGGPKALDYGDVIFDGACDTSLDEFVAEALRLIARNARGAVLYLTNVREDARAIAPLRSRLRVFKTSSAPYAPIAGTWEDYLFSRGRHLRHNFDRLWRRLNSQGHVEFRLLTHDAPEVPASFERLVAFQRARFDALAKRTNLFDERYVDFRRQQATADPNARIATLSLDGACLAVSLHVVFRTRFYCLVTGFDDRYAGYSPGLLLHGNAVRACFENGWDPCDFCWGNEAYKYTWADRETALTTFVDGGATGAALTMGASVARRVAKAIGDARKKGQAAQSEQG